MRRIKFRKNCFYHIYNRGNRKKKIFYQDKNYKKFLNYLEKYSTIFKIRIVNYCLMSNHYHIIIQPKHQETAVPQFMHRLGLCYTLYINKKYNLVGHLFQGKYQVKFINQNQLSIVQSYVRNNPVEQAIVDKWQYYKWVN
ncbi:transposase [Candidatus Dojkabacteria bacterium]|nr:transposase [Candidatus Dojkabacteria bacterium]